MSSPTRWAGVPLTDRRAERRALLVEAAFELFGAEGESAVSVRSVCRRTSLNTRYFYESFPDTDQLLGAVYDRVAEGLNAEVEAAIAATDGTDVEQSRAGIRAVLGFSSADPRRGRVLFTEARANPVLSARREIAQELLRQMVLSERAQAHPREKPVKRPSRQRYTPARWPNWRSSGWRATSATTSKPLSRTPSD